MSIATLVLGEPGSGKSTSLRNMDPAHTLLIQTVRKPLPFRSSGWAEFSKDNPSGNIFITDQSSEIINIMRKTKREIIVIDDWNLIMTNEFMRRSAETGFAKFSEIGRSAWDVLMAASSLPKNVRVYLMGHVETDESGHIRAKTIGKLISEKCPVESLFSIVMRTAVVNGSYLFHTKNSGSDTCKTPIGLFDSELIENDLSIVDSSVYQYYQIQKAGNNFRAL